MTAIQELYQLMADGEAAAQLESLRQERLAWLDWKPFIEVKQRFEDLPHRSASVLQLDRAWVTIGERLPDEHPDRLLIEAAARALLPWKKGPYRLYGIEIDSEWRSDYKWDRREAHLPDLAGQVILDVGCNNGYFLFRMLPHRPRLVIGIDPVPRWWYQFHLLQRYARIPEVAYELWGWQELEYFPGIFDTIFCMGILYHHSNPVQILKNLYRALKPGGLLVLESIVIPGKGSHCLLPPDRYARMRNVWFVPTSEALCHMLRRSKFSTVEVIEVHAHRIEEQRTTVWSPGPSFADFLMDDNRENTVEGHPAPLRAIVFAKKKR